jgi:hypothetical protein
MRALTDPNWRTAGQALDDLMRKLLVVHRLLEAEERLATASRVATRCNQSFTYQTARFATASPTRALDLGNRSTSAGGFRLAPPAEPPALAWRRPGSEP